MIFHLEISFCLLNLFFVKLTEEDKTEQMIFWHKFCLLYFFQINKKVLCNLLYRVSL